MLALSFSISLIRKPQAADREIEVNCTGLLQDAWMLSEHLSDVSEPNIDELRRAGLFEVNVHKKLGDLQDELSSDTEIEAGAEHIIELSHI